MSEEGIPTPEEKNHTGLIIGIVLITIVVLLALFVGLYFGLRNKGGDTPEEVNPDPEIVEPGPVEDPDGGDGGDEEPVATYISVLGADDLVIYYSTTGDEYSTSINLRETLTVTVYDQFGIEYTGNGGSEYTLSTIDTDIISLDDTKGIVSALRAGEAHITITSVANENIFTDITITVEDLDIEVTSISVSLSGTTNDDGYILLDWGATSSELEVTFTPTDATVQTYEVTPKLDENDDVLFAYNETTHTFTHTKLNTGTQTFVITATDQSNEASTEITLECDPVIDEPYEVVWRDDEEHSLPETIAKNESIENLDDYVEVHYNHTGQDEHEYEDDTYTLSYAGSNGVKIEGSKATFTGDGGTTQYITVTATPSNDAGSPVYVTSEDITITQAIEWIEINCTEYVFEPLRNYNFTGIAVWADPDDAWPIPEVTWTVTGGNAEEYVTIELYDYDSTQCTIRTTDKANSLGEGVYIDGITVTAYMDGIAVGTCEIAITTYDFELNSWDLIEKTAAAGEASTYYSVGDTKTITIGSEEHKIRIIDFDHDDLTNTDGNGYNDENYNGGSNKAAITCEMVDCLSTTHNMNSTNTNSGGWAACAMRSYLNTGEGCVFSTIETDLQSVIRLVDKVTTNGGGSTDTTTSSDSLFLLSKIELDGTSTTGYVNEGTEYEYYSEHNTASNMRKTVSGTYAYWWLRSPYYSIYSYSYFYYVNESGYSNHSNGAATNTYGVSFAFCI